MKKTIPLRYEGGGIFRCIRPNLIPVEPGELAGWQLAEDRSRQSHDHFFACIHQAWLNLPDDMVDQFPTPEHLRKWALIRAGYCTMSQIVCKTPGDAIKLSSTVTALDRYALVSVEDSIVTIWTADSQRRDAMGRQVFQEAKEKSLHIVSELIGTDVTTLGSEAEKQEVIGD